MSTKNSSRNLLERLSRALNTGATKPVAAPVSKYVDAVREHYVNHARNSGSQQHRLRYGTECWLISKERWADEQLAAGASDEEILMVVEGSVVELQAKLAARRAPQGVARTLLADVVREEIILGAHDDLATRDAETERSPAAARKAVKMALAQAAGLRRKAQTLAQWAYDLTHHGAQRAHTTGAPGA